MANFARGLQMGVSTASEALRSMAEQERADREKEMYERQKAYEADLRAAAEPAEVKTRQGLQVTGEDGKSFYIPSDNAAVAKAYTDAGYKVGDRATGYQDVNAGSMTLGQNATADGPTQADGLMQSYNKGMDERQAVVARKHGKFSDAAAINQLSMYPMQKRKGEIEMAGLERGLVVQKRKDDVAARWANPDKRMQELYDGNVGGFGQGVHKDATLGLQKLPDGGAIVWQKGKDGKMIGDAKMVSADDVRKETQKAMLADMIAADPTNTDLLLKASELGIKRDEMDARAKHWEREGEHWKRVDANAALQLRATIAHYGTTAAHQIQMYEIAKGQAALDKERFGVDSPTYKKAAAEVAVNKEINDGIAELAKMIDSGADPKAVAKKTQVVSMNMATHDRLPKITVIDPATNLPSQKTVNPLEVRLDAYTKQRATELAAEADKKYGVGAKIDVVVHPGGVIAWRTAGLPPGKDFESLDELVKLMKLKPVTDKKGLRESTAPAPAASETADFVKARRGGFVIDAPARSPARVLAGKSYGSREEAEAALRKAYGE